MENTIDKKSQQPLKMSRLPVPPSRKRPQSDENQEQSSRVEVTIHLLSSFLERQKVSPVDELPRLRVAASIATSKPRVTPAVALPKPQVIGRQSLQDLQPKNRANITASAKPKATAPAPAQSATSAAGKKRAAWDLKGQVNDMKDKVTNYKGKVQSLSGENARLQTTKQQLQRQVELLNTENSAISQQLCSVESKLLSERKKLDGAKKEVQQLTELCQTLQSELSAEKCVVVQMSSCNESMTLELKAKEKQLLYLEGENSTLNTLVTEQSDSINDLQCRVAEKDTQIYTLETERRRLHNAVQELKGNIRVFCRVRPTLPFEKASSDGPISFPPNDEKAIVLSKVEESHIGREKGQSVKYDFNFDCIFPPTTSQAAVFEEISLLVQSALDGYPVCIFAYGQTGSGKTYTMEGPDNISVDTMGMIPRAIWQIFSSADELKSKGWQYKFTASFLEIYNETLRDLLVNRPEKKNEYDIRKVNSSSNEVYVTNLRYVEVSSVEEVHEILQTAKTNRSVAKTALNDRSSRSHSVFQLRIEGENSLRDVRTSSVLSLIDLAGSERLDRSLSTGDRLKETQSINTSLSTLGLVITSLCNKDSHIPYRNSKLTYLLQNSLGGNSKVLMFVNISPLEENFAESVNSLRFASKVNECVIGTARANRK